MRAVFHGVFDLHAPNASECQKSLSEKYPYRVLSTGAGAGKLPPQTSQLPPPPKFSWEKNIRLFQIKIFFDDDFKESVKVTNVQKCDFSQSGWPNSQLPIRNLLSYDAQTWWLLVFILKARSDQILAKLINQGGYSCSFLIEMSQKIRKWKNFPLLENFWNWHEGLILVREERFCIKTHFLKVKPVFRG